MRRFLRVVLVAGVLLTALLAAAGHMAWRDLNTPWRAWPGEEVFVEIPPGAGAGVIARRLQEAGVVPSARMLTAWLRLRGEGADLQAGEYRFRRPASPLEVLERLRAGDVFLHRLTLPEGLDLEEVRALLASWEGWDPQAVEEALARPGLVQDLAPEARSLEGYLFPETYSFPRSTDPADLVETMVDRFRQVFDEDLRGEAEALGLTVHEAVTLASLIEEEVRLPSEAPLVSSVLHNRLERGMRLEVDATVIYALRRAGRYDPPLLRRDLEFESPWNTYRVAGLPAGPIASPGRVALESAVRPAETEYLYYVLKPEGTGAHHFSRSYREHQQAVRRLHRSR